MSAPTALVTGAARGMGAAVTARLVRRGFHVVALDSCAGSPTDAAARRGAGAAYALATRADLEAVAAAYPGDVTPVVADARDLDAMTRVADGLADRELTVVVAAAGVIAGGAALWDTDNDVLDALWQADVVSVWNTAKVTLPLLLRREAAQRPAFVAVASAAGHHGLHHLTAYTMAKHAVVGLVKGLAADVVGHPVTVAGVSPGSTDTAMLAATAAIYGLPDTAELVRAQTIGRALAADEVAAVIEFACTAGPVVHGSILHADGGFGS